MTETMKCNMCDIGEMEHTKINNTHVYICDQCPNVQFEYIDTKDLNNLFTLLEGSK